MKRCAVWTILVCSFVVLAGCGQWFRHDVPDDPNNRLPGSSDFSLSDLLGKSRAELANRSKAFEERIDKQLEGFHQGQLEFALLPDARVSRDAPVFREVEFNQRLGFSLPPYGRDPDNGLALHLAQFGDLDAARRLTIDADTLADITRCELDRNYPVEWTRLVGLMQTEARIRLASNDSGAAADLAEIHRQLRELFDEKTTKSPLGAVLLGAGKKSLEEAAVAWRAGKNEGRAQEAEQMLADWGEVP
jgi:hypothetical protein